MSLPVSVLNKYPNSIFVETGTYLGGGVATALGCKSFSKIYSIEVYKPYYTKAKKKFSNNTKVKLYYGDSLEVLEKLIDNIDVPVTFWLDSYTFPALNKKKGIATMPLVNELDIIRSHKLNIHTILVNNRSLMGSINEWKNVTEHRIIRMLKVINPEYSIIYENSNLAKDDIVVATL